MFQLELPISSMLGGLFSRGVDSAPHLRERAGNRNAQSHHPKRSKQIKIIKQNSPRAVVSRRHSLFQASHGLMLVGGRYSHLIVVALTVKVCRSKCYSISILKLSSSTSTNPCFPSTKGLSILLLC